MEYCLLLTSRLNLPISNVHQANYLINQHVFLKWLLRRVFFNMKVWLLSQSLCPVLLSTTKQLVECSEGIEQSVEYCSLISGGAGAEKLRTPCLLVLEANSRSVVFAVEWTIIKSMPVLRKLFLRLQNEPLDAPKGAPK